MICRYLPYTITLRAPALLTSLGGDPDSSRTLQFIPGAALRGAAARVFVEPGADATRLEEFRTLILGGDVRYLNAYLRVDGNRTLPMPVSFRAKKHGSVGLRGDLPVWDLAALADDKNGEGDFWPEESLSPLSDPFVSLGAAQPLRVSPARGSRIHQQRDRARGRAWKDEHDGREEPHGAIFAFEFLEAGQEFDGLIQVQAETEAACEALLATVKKALDGPILLGRSRRGGYGGDATIAWGIARTREVEGQRWIQADLPANTRFRALLTSACIARDLESGQLQPDYVATEIVERLQGRVDVLARRWSFERVGGFNRKWRLEVPQALACAAGSVLVLETNAPIPLADLLAIENDGLGERRVEGFGRVAFLDAATKSLTLRLPSTPRRPAPTGPVPELVQFAENRILQAAVERVIDEEAARTARSATGVPAPSLLGRLRNTLRAEPPSALETLRTWLAPQGPHRLKRPAMDQLDRCRIRNDQRLSSWIRSTAEGHDNQTLVEHLRLDSVRQRAHIVSETTASKFLADRESWIRARLIDSTLAALARKQRGRRQP